jgi:hypothetical protein
VVSVSDQDALKYSSQTYLAFVPSSSSQLNEQTQDGLETLSAALKEKTSVEPAGVVQLDLEKDELNFFPFIYWPITPETKPLSENAERKVQNYINSGGVILFDTRNSDSRSRSALALQRLMKNINVKPLVPMNSDHTLTKTFYLMSNMPGTDAEGTIWVEQQENNDPENVSSVIIGSKNWVSAWAGMSHAPGSQEREDAIRSGVNIVMYALTGTYKDDLSHVPEILKRMKEK